MQPMAVDIADAAVEMRFPPKYGADTNGCLRRLAASRYPAGRTDRPAEIPCRLYGDGVVDEARELENAKRRHPWNRICLRYSPRLRSAAAAAAPKSPSASPLGATGPGRVARHPVQERVPAGAQDPGRRAGALHHPGRRVQARQRGQERPQVRLRGQGRRHDGLERRAFRRGDGAGGGRIQDAADRADADAAAGRRTACTGPSSCRSRPS